MEMNQVTKKEILLSTLFIFISINFYRLIFHEQYIGILPIIIQISLMSMILFKSEYSKIGIKIWSGFFLILGSSFKIVGIFIELLFKEFKTDWLNLFWQFVILGLGLYFFISYDKENN